MMNKLDKVGELLKEKEVASKLDRFTPIEIMYAKNYPYLIDNEEKRKAILEAVEQEHIEQLQKIKEARLEQERAYRRRYYQNNKKFCNAITIRWQKKNPEKFKAAQKKYYLANREKILAQQRAYYHKKKSEAKKTMENNAT